MEDTNDKQFDRKIIVFSDFATLLSYPRSLQSLLESINRIKGEKIRSVNDKLQPMFDRICDQNTKLSTFEEAYTSSFDLNPQTHLYMAAHLYGETYKRSNFMIKLKEEFSKDQFVIPNNELPDHLAVLLEYISICPDEPRNYLLSKLIVPVLDKIVLGKPIAIKIPLQSELRSMDQDLKKFEPVKKTNYYIKVLHALHEYIHAKFGGVL